MSKTDLTQILKRASGGDPDALDELLPHVYADLRKLARMQFAKEKAGHTFQPTALVHEAFMRVAQVNQIEWQSREHFFRTVGRIMRQVLLDHAKAKRAQKRGGAPVKVEYLDEEHGAAPAPEIEDLDEALKRLEKLNERQARIVELRYFAGMSVEEVASALELSPATVKRDWNVAKAWLFQELAGKSVA